ncbi:MAG: ABC transporter permease [Candidatus Bathyarchaeia archaeon]
MQRKVRRLASSLILLALLAGILIIFDMQVYPGFTRCYGLATFQTVSIMEQMTSFPSINIKVVDARTGEPIKNATIILWDFFLYKSNIYFTDENGECSIFGINIRLGRLYWLYAYKGDLREKRIDYAPAKREIYLKEPKLLNLTLSLVPGALIELEGMPYIVQSSSLEERYMGIRIVETKPSNYTFVQEYGNSPDTYLLGLARRTVIVPANIPFTLEVSVWSPQGVEIFYISNGSSPFLARQGEILSSINIPYYSLRRGLKYVESAFVEVSRKVDSAQSIGFTVFDERRILIRIGQRIMDAERLLQSAVKDEDYERIWLMLREALGEINYISVILQNKYLISKTSAIYLSAVMAVFSVVLAFFFFENEKKKAASNVIIYVLLIVSLYLTYPGAHLIINENLMLFLISASVSFTVISAVIFGIPRVWKERSIEGEVSWRSAISIIFSMGKRQIKRKRIRGFFTIFSLCILILAFTSLTSFGTVFGIVSDKINVTPPSEGVLVRRMINGSSLLFLPLGSGDIAAVSKIMPITNVALRFKNQPTATPIARLVNYDTGASHFIYGVVAISPTNETLYTRLREVINGEYLRDDGFYEVLITSSVANKLGVGINGKIYLEVLGVIIEGVIVKGLISDEKYENLMDIDGSYFGPSRLEDSKVRRCNSTEIMIVNLRTAERIQNLVDEKYYERGERGTLPPQFVLLSEIIFQPAVAGDIEYNIKRLVSAFGYDVFVSLKNAVYYYHIGSYIEFKGAAELLIPIIMVILNVSMVMVNSAYERSKEIRVLSMLGLNPTHIGLTFVAEATVMGMVGGSIGYVSGLGFYRIMLLFGQDLMVREKLEWWWSALGFALAILISVLSAMRPAAIAVSAYTPSKVKRIKRSEEEMRKRKEEIFRVYQAREMSMPVKVLVSEKEFFVNYFLNSLEDLKTGYTEKIEDIEDVPEIESPRGELIKTIKFVHCFGPLGPVMRTKNTLTLIKGPRDEYYRVRLTAEPALPGMPENAIERTVDLVHEILMRWVRDKKRIMGIF